MSVASLDNSLADAAPALTDAELDALLDEVLDALRLPESELRALGVIGSCSECGARITRASGQPRRTCGDRCRKRRSRRRA